MSTNPHAQAISQLHSVIELLRPLYKDRQVEFDEVAKQLAEPDRVIEKKLTVSMDDGSSKSFTAWRSQHNNALGPYKGGIRFHPQVSREEVMALSTWMTWKCSVAGLPYGGGKGGIMVNPKELSESELQRLSRAYAREFSEHIGPWQDIPAPDVNTSGQIMAWMVDEWRQHQSSQLSVNPVATFTGKPLEIGGSEGREEATGLGGVLILDQLMTKLDRKRRKDVTIAIQGFGNVGYWLAVHADRLGYKVVAVSDSKGGVYSQFGLDPVKTLECKKKSGKITECICVNGVCDLTQGRPLTNDELLSLEVDVLVPAALEGAITQDNAETIQAKIVLEMANGPVTPEADKILQQKQIMLVPDILANSGGVTTSYFEWAQNISGLVWPKDEVIEKLTQVMKRAFTNYWQIYADQKVDGRMAAYMIGVKRVIDAMMISR